MIIPKPIYRRIEKKLRDRDVLVASAKARLMDAQRALAACGMPSTDAEPAGKNSHGNRTQRLAIAIAEAEEELQKAQQWADVLRLVDAAFPYPGTQEGEVAHWIYGCWDKIGQVCRIMHCDRETVQRRRDSYVVYAALIAAGKGLIDITKEAEP